MTTDRQTKQRRKGCYEVAMQRARRARQRGLNPFLVAVLFVWVFLAASFDRGTRPAPVPRARNGQALPDDWPMTDYERGHPGPFRRRSSHNGSRYRVRPSLQRLVVDLRRPAARADAAAALALRISDPAIRAWVVARIDKEEFERLAIPARLGRSEEAVLAAWQDEAKAALAEEVASGKGMDAAPDRTEMLRAARLLEALAGTETVTSEGLKQSGKI